MAEETRRARAAADPLGRDLLRELPLPTVQLVAALLERPEEPFALGRREVDRPENLLRYSPPLHTGVLHEGGKTDGSVRAVALRSVVLDELDKMPPRIDSPLLFPTPRGKHIDIEKFRHREWAPRAAGIAHRRLYDCRHLCDVGDRERHRTLVPRPSDGHERRSDRGHLRAMAQADR
jgi:hypothetical protein